MLETPSLWPKADLLVAVADGVDLALKPGFLVDEAGTVAGVLACFEAVR